MITATPTDQGLRVCAISAVGPETSSSLNMVALLFRFRCGVTATQVRRTSSSKSPPTKCLIFRSGWYEFVLVPPKEVHGSRSLLRTDWAGVFYNEYRAKPRCDGKCPISRITGNSGTRTHLSG